MPTLAPGWFDYLAYSYFLARERLWQSRYFVSELDLAAGLARKQFERLFLAGQPHIGLNMVHFICNLYEVHHLYPSRSQYCVRVIFMFGLGWVGLWAGLLTGWTKLMANCPEVVN